MAGILYLCATPIGNLEDMTYRAVRILDEVDLIAAEDTRNSVKLLNHFEINTPMTSYHHNNRYDKADYLIGVLNEGKNIALISDAGMPGISDPGEELVKKCIENGITVSPIPGATAGLSALICSGFSTREFCFEGFLPAEKKDAKKLLEALKNETRTMIFYEAPHRLLKTLSLFYEFFGDREIAVCKELTKKHETFLYMTLGEAISFYESNEPKGEFVLILKGMDRKVLEEQSQAEFLEMSLEDHMQMYLDRGMDKKEAMKRVAKDRGVTKRDIYKLLIE